MTRNTTGLVCQIIGYTCLIALGMYFGVNILIRLIKHLIQSGVWLSVLLPVLGVVCVLLGHWLRGPEEAIYYGRDGKQVSEEEYYAA